MLRKVLPVISTSRQNMSDHSLLILALAAWKNGAQTRSQNPGKSPLRSDRARRSTRWLKRPLAFSSRKASTRPAPTASRKWRASSVGSLYQYFPSKEALVAAVIERHQQEIMQTVRGELAEVLDAAGGEGGAQARRRRGQGASRRSQAASRARGADSARGQAREAGNLQSRELRAVQDVSREPPRRNSCRRPGARIICMRDLDRGVDAQRGAAPFQRCFRTKRWKRSSTRARAS